MRRIILAAAAVLATASGITGITLASAMSASAQSSCTGVSSFTDAAGKLAPIPTIGNNNRRDNCDLGVGNDSYAVVALQQALDYCYGQGLTIDGDYGALTKAAVEHVQSAVHITVDGVYGPQTRDHIKWWDSVTPCAKL